MLSRNQVVRARKAIESLYNGLCTVIIREKYTKVNTSTGLRDKIIIKDEPCRLSYSSASSAQQGEVAASISQTVELFISPDINIPPGSKITITQNGETVAYKRSGVKAKYNTHQEIILELWEGWA